MREVWAGDEAALAVRLSCSDWVEGGNTIEETVVLSHELKKVVATSLYCCVRAAVVSAVPPLIRATRSELAERIRKDIGIATLRGGHGFYRQAGRWNHQRRAVPTWWRSVAAISIDPRWAWHAG